MTVPTAVRIAWAVLAPGAAGDDAGGEGDVQSAGGGQHKRQERPWTPKPKR
jgi:hypothetical protein